MKNYWINKKEKDTFQLQAGINAANAITFNVNGKAMMAIGYNGDFYVNGKIVANDIEVFEGMKNWMITMNLIPSNTVFPSVKDEVMTDDAFMKELEANEEVMDEAFLKEIGMLEDEVMNDSDFMEEFAKL